MTFGFTSNSTCRTMIFVRQILVLKQQTGTSENFLRQKPQCYKSLFIVNMPSLVEVPAPLWRSEG